MEIDLHQPIAVIADVHGNSDALRAVLDDIDRAGIGAILNLGDHLSGPLAAAETAEMLMARDMLSIRGNHDRWLTGQARADMAPSDAAAHDQLSADHLDWLRSLPATAQVGDAIFLCHGTPDSDTTYWMEQVRADGTVTRAARDAIEAAAAGRDFPVILCGHTHTPRLLRLADGRLLLNPGSVGLPAYDDDTPVPHVMQTGSPAARYAILHRRGASWDVTLRAVPYETDRMVALARAAGRPEWGAALATGWLQRLR